MDQALWYGMKGLKNIMGTGTKAIATVIGSPLILADNILSRFVKNKPAEVAITVPDHIADDHQLYTRFVVDIQK